MSRSCRERQAPKKKDPAQDGGWRGKSKTPSSDKEFEWGWGVEFQLDAGSSTGLRAVRTGFPGDQGQTTEVAGWSLEGPLENVIPGLSAEARLGAGPWPGTWWLTERLHSTPVYKWDAEQRRPSGPGHTEPEVLA